MVESIYSKREYHNKDADFRIGVVISDGMWYTSTKWRKIAKVSEEEIEDWIRRHKHNGMLVQSNEGTKSYRFPLESVKKWHFDNGFEVGDQIIDFLFPARVWDGKTETEGFLEQPLREIGMVTFECDAVLAKEIKEALRGLARIRETKPNTYRAYCLDSELVKDRVDKITSKYKLKSEIKDETRINKDRIAKGSKNAVEIDDDEYLLKMKCSKSLKDDILDKVLNKYKGNYRIECEREGDSNKSSIYNIVLTDLESSDKDLIIGRIQNYFVKYPESKVQKVRSRPELKRRELIDFSYEFRTGLVEFYRSFAKTLVKRHIETIKIFLPEEEDQEVQVIMWVIEAIEKFDESASVPFSGYLNTALNHWPYDLPTHHLGVELSAFQRSKNRIIKQYAQDGEWLSNESIADIMDIDKSKYDDLDDRDKMWRASKSATTLTWEETGEEKVGTTISGRTETNKNTSKDIYLTNALSVGAIKAALETDKYTDAFLLIKQIDANEINFAKIQDISDDFIQKLGTLLGYN